MKLILSLIAAVLLLSGCINPDNVNVASNYSNQSASNINSNNTSNIAPQNNQSDSITNSSNYGTTNGGGSTPYISGTTVGPSNPSRGQPVNITISAKDTEGLQGIYWESSDTFTTSPASASFECNSQTTCNVTWTFTSTQDGLKTINVYAKDSGGQTSSKTPLQITVQPRDYQVPTGPTCGNNVCESGEADSCSTDCPATTTNTTGVTNDTTSGQTSCEYNSQCTGFRQICSSGQCIDVECTNSGQCGLHEYCSYNSCVKCRRDYETGNWGC